VNCSARWGFNMILVTCPQTCFGVIEKKFSAWDDAFAWIRVCVANDVFFTITTLD